MAGARHDRYAVVGHPIAHSRSPFIHAQFARQTGEPVSYVALDVEPGRFEERVDAFRAEGGRGLNVTLPLKEIAFAYATELGERAQRAGAVNTLRFEARGGVYGDNTDGAGLVRDLCQNLGVALKGARVLLLGAGGAARGVLGPLLDARPRRLVVANRTAARAEALAAAFATDAHVEAVGLDAIPETPFDLVLNATASGLHGEPLPISREHVAPSAFCYDMMYGAQPTAFLRKAAALGAARCADGRGMLVEQAAESFLLWRGVRPRTAPVIEALTRCLSEG
jgi:shikimate dehydrogenase